MIAVICMVVGLLPLLAWFFATWGEALDRTAHQAAAAPQSVAVRVRSQAVAGQAVTRIASHLDSFLTTQVHNQQFSGAVLVAQHGQIVLERGYGIANWQTSTPVTVNTRFYLGSITKQFTAMATLLLQQQGKLHVSDKICQYITNCPTAWQPVTIHNLLTHTSGIPEPDDTQLSGMSPQAWIGSFADTQLAFRSGAQFDYCSTCYQILAYVVQQAAGMPYSQFVRQTILHPLHMDSSGFDADAYYARPNDAIGYVSWQVDAPRVDEHADPQWSFLFGSGLLYSTVEDLYRWDQALYNHTLLPQQALQQAFTPYIAAPDFPGQQQYGYGWYISQSPPGHALLWHDGEFDGFRNYIGRYVNDDATIIFLSNLSTVDLFKQARDLEKIVFTH